MSRPTRPPHGVAHGGELAGVARDVLFDDGSQITHTLLPRVIEEASNDALALLHEVRRVPADRELPRVRRESARKIPGVEPSPTARAGAHA